MSSGFSYPQPIFISPIYNPSFYLTLDSNGYLTYQYAQSLYFSKNDYRLTYITGITPGTAVSGRALVLDDTGSIATISSLTATNITGTLLTASQPNITSIGALTSLTATNITGTLLTASQPNITSLGTLTSLTATNITGTLQTAAQTNITSLGTLTGLVISGNLSFPGASRTITGLNSLTSTNINGTIITAAQANITSIGTLSSLTLDMAGVGLNIPSLRFNGINFNSNYYLNITLGSATASQALVLNASKGITGLGYVSGDTLNATTLVSGTSGDFGSLSINSISVISSSRTIQNIGTITTSDTIKCSRASSAQTFNSTNGTSTMALYHFVNGDGYFGSTSSNDFVLQTNNVARMRINGSTGAISGITNLTASGTITANSLAGFLTYGNQTAITTVGPLTEFGINTTATTEYFAIKGSGSAYLDGTYTRMCRFLGSNATPVEFQIEVNNGSYDDIKEFWTPGDRNNNSPCRHSLHEPIYFHLGSRRLHCISPPDGLWCD
ncbi:uncharacterized protein PHALS_10204 [Plasmopara halstedii]|uniref:Uncharacterized protein n=1 Tax=Plasmopara halstedii TaxID=4781 RepID=A0A0P1AG29_PLAHL|nr:uncharacterized protein PHALS_10204 [Plasmopara halstedii]CEG39980.1 hypothetical protein PHALS_10204 [Plasmopara halstedii]|eukprot:XP_024576349.1 hypothetical protein PHALS_10204 [Plasmopara halstedii]